MDILAYIQSNPDWERQLAGAPYFIKTKRDGGFVLLKYNQIESDLTIPLVRECRGIILDGDDNFRPVCVPFFKFGNYGESYVPEIDWQTARVQEKLDGSLMKLWHCKGRWHISSNGEIDARNATLSSALLTGSARSNLHELFVEAWQKTGVPMDSLDKDHTYMFELTSPHNRIVVLYGEVAIRHIGTRNNLTFLECDMDIGIEKPRTLPLGTLAECLESAKALGYDHEGYVIVDGRFNRVKVKSPLYVALSNLVQGVVTHGNIIEIIRKNEQDEFLTYFPEYKEVFNDVAGRIDAFAKRQDQAVAGLKTRSFDSRKALAEAITKTECPACLFSLIDKKAPNAKEWLMSRPAGKIGKYVGLG